MQKSLWLILVAVAVGGLVPIQSSINAHLGQFVKSPLQATLINFFGGVVVLLIILVLFYKNPLPAFSELKQIPWHLFFGGLFGVIFVSTVVILTPKIGITNMLAGAMVGQLIISAVVDHYGLLNIPVHPISWQRALGISMLVGGIILTQK